METLIKKFKFEVFQLLILLTTTSCETEMDIEKDFPVDNKLVVMSILSPEWPIEVMVAKKQKNKYQRLCFMGEKCGC